METDPTRMCELLVGLGDVDLVGIDDSAEGTPLEVVIRSRRPRPVCGDCGGGVWSKGERSVRLVDCRRSGGRFGLGGGSVAGPVVILSVWSARLLNKTQGLDLGGRC